MSTKSEWQAVQARVLAERRQRLGEPPTAEEMLAYSRGELQGEEEERVRALLVTYPELLRALQTDFEDVPKKEARVFQFSRYLAPIAAAVAVILGVMLWRAQSQVNEPRFVDWQHETLEPANYRGPADGVKTLSSDADVYVLDILLSDERQFSSYRVDLVEGATRRVIWSRTSARPEGDTFSLLVPRTKLRTGRYDAVVYGIGDQGSQQLASYPFRIR